MPRLSAPVVVLALFLPATQVWALVSVVLLAVTPGVLNAVEVESRVLPKTLGRSPNRGDAQFTGKNHRPVFEGFLG